MTDPWNPALYSRFGDARTRPFWDLLDLVQPRPGMRVVDLGCGTGELTRGMHDRLQVAETLGIDSSPTMLAQAAAHTADGLRFQHLAIEAFVDRARWDLVFSNAAIQFVNDHAGLVERLRNALAPGGQLAIQVPAMHEHISQTAAAEVAGEEPFRTELDGFVRRSPVLTPEEYAVLLHRLGFAEQHVRLVVYGNLLDSRDDVVDWLRSGALTDYGKRLSPASFDRFVERYRELLIPQLGDERPYLFPFKRILLWAAL